VEKSKDERPREPILKHEQADHEESSREACRKGKHEMTMQPATTAGTIDSRESKFAGLRRFNVLMGFLHLIQGVFMILVSNSTTYPIFTNYLNFNLEIFSLSPNPQLLYDLRFGPAVAAFLLISAVAHFYLATIGYTRYVRDLSHGINPVRFYEYAFSSSLMIVLIGMLVGIF
jgi:hypothetical protein